MIRIIGGGETDVVPIPNGPGGPGSLSNGGGAHSVNGVEKYFISDFGKTGSSVRLPPGMTPDIAALMN